MHPLEQYLRHISVIRSSGAGVPETSYYGALEALFNQVGSELKPRVHCVLHPRNVGAGIPDGGLFTADQVRDDSVRDRLASLAPARGVIEVKASDEETTVTAQTDQVTIKYLPRYGQVLVTNLRDFILIGKDTQGNQVTLEAFRLADNEDAFWRAAVRPAAIVTTHGDRFVDYLKRVMLHPAPLSDPEDVAWFLASYARDAMGRIEHMELEALTSLRSEFEDALGLTFEGEKGNHFFRSTLVQTLFYGIFSAWVLWSNENRNSNSSQFDWRLTGWLLRVPMVRSLFHQVTDPSRLKPLGLVQVLDWTATVLNRVNREVFFERFEDEHAVQYFYEPFLQAFDPDLRRELGVWYTPPEIVKYMVARVDTVLREELDVPDGLADPNVYILDPATGTGSYLVEVLRSIDATLRARGVDALSAHRVKQAAIERVFGFEILPAPFVIAHLQLGLFLQNLGAPLAPSERAGVFLTNALTGWEPATGPKQRLPTLELEQERDAAEVVKRDKPILVVIGNPPYNAFAGISPDEEHGLVDPYKEGLVNNWGIKKFNLDDLYIRFFRLAERRITEMTGRGVVCYISNFSYVDKASFVAMRARFLREFDDIWIDRLNGDSRETGKRTPDGEPDPSVFSTRFNKQGIQKGTAIGLMVRRSSRREEPVVQFRNLWGVNKREDLLESLDVPSFSHLYERVEPAPNNRFSFRTLDVSPDYLSWPTIEDLALRFFAGIAEDRGKALIDIDRASLEQRMKAYFNPDVSWAELTALQTGLTRDAPRFNAKKTRDKLTATEGYEDTRIIRIAMRPMDYQWCYYTPVRPLWREPRPEYGETYDQGTMALVTRAAASRTPEGPPLIVSSSLSDYHMMPPNSSVFPLTINAVRRPSSTPNQPSLFEEESSRVANVSMRTRSYLETIGFTDPDTMLDGVQAIWRHSIAMTYSPYYLSENRDGIREDWPRIPLPLNNDTLCESSELGKRVSRLLDTIAPVPTVTSGEVRKELRTLCNITRVGGGNLTPNTRDLYLDANWGYVDRRRAVMPGAGRAIERTFTIEEQDSLGEYASKLLGDTTLDVYLNGAAYWSNVPVRVWDYTIGGYQVIKKWLSYREHGVLGRALTPDEVQEVTDMARRIAALILLEPELDRNYIAVKSKTYNWPAETKG